MRVDGQLERAQLEQLVGAPSAPQPTGRIISDVTTPTAALPKYWNGTAWQTLAFTTAAAAALVTQNSGQAVTVNWANGLYQQVQLTNHCVISFSNPVAGAIHTLIVTSAPLVVVTQATIYGFTFNMPDQDSRRMPYQYLGQLAPFGSQVFSWFYSAGIKPAYSTVPAFAQQPVSPATLVQGIAFSADGNFLLMGQTGTPFSTGYLVYNGEQMTQSPLGYKDIVASAAAAATVVACEFTPDNRSAFVVSGTTPFIQGFFLDRGKPTGTAFTNPATLPAGAGQCLSVHPQNMFVAVGHATTPFMSVYPLTGTGFGTKITNPTQLPDAQVNAVAFSRTGDFIAAVSQTTPFLRVWQFNPNGGAGAFGSVVASPAALPNGGPGPNFGGQGVAWNPAGTFIAVAMSVTPYLYIVPFNRLTASFGTALTITALSGAASCVAWTPDGNYLLVGTTVTPFLYIYDMTSGVPVAVTYDNGGSDAPTIAVNCMAIHPNGEYVVLGCNTGAFIYQQTLPQKIRNYLRIVD